MGVACTAITLGCVEYQVEPYAEATYRDEEFSRGNPLDYDGMTYTVGIRYVAPTRISHLPPLRVDALPTIHTHGPDTPTQVDVNVEGSEAARGVVGELSELANSAREPDGSWSPWAAAVAIALILGFREFQHAKNK